MPDFCRTLLLTLLQFTDVMNLMSAANVSMHTSMPKEDILAFTQLKSTHTIKFILLILSIFFFFSYAFYEP